MEHAEAPSFRVVFLGHLPAIAWLFGSALVGGRVPYARDVSAVYAPDFAFLSRALEQGVWPLWNPFVDGGAPCLFAYPVDLLLAGLFGPRGPLGPGAALHLFIGMCGASALARRLGRGPLGAWLAGSVYGLSGYFLSLMNLLQLLDAAAWAPWVLAGFLGLLEAPTRRKVALLSLLVALQLSTLGAEIALQTLLAGLLLASWRQVAGNRAIRWLAASAVLAGLIAAPAILGGAWLIEGSGRARGFTSEQALAYSASPAVLLEAAVPRLFGDVHAFSEVGYWGQPFFPQGYPYLLSLYVGPIVIALALFAPWGRLHLLLALGGLLSLGAHGPFARLFFTYVPFLRGPVKFFFLATLALALLAGQGLERVVSSSAHRRRAQIGLVAVGAATVAAGLALGQWPDLAARLLEWWLPELAAARAQVVAQAIWPSAWTATGAACLAAGLVFAAPLRFTALVAAVTVIDLLTVNGSLNPLSDRSFYDLRPPMADLVGELKREGPYRVFSYGGANSPRLRWQPQVARSGSDVWLYYVDRQALLPRTHEIEGLEGIFDNDRTGWAPEGATVTLAESLPSAFPRILARLREANVRWVLSFEPLPGDLVTLRRSVPFPELLDPLLVYEIPDALPRALWVTRVPDRLADLRPEPGGSAEYRRIDPHTVEVRVAGDPGEIVVLDYAHRGWRLEGGALQPFGRHFRWATPGGQKSFVLRFRPTWVAPALAFFTVGAILALVLLALPRPMSPQRLDSAEPAL